MNNHPARQMVPNRVGCDFAIEKIVTAGVHWETGMEYLLLWLVFGAAAASMAKSKGRSVALWTLVGLLIGPFAVLVVAVMKPVSGAEQKYL